MMYLSSSASLADFWYYDPNQDMSAHSSSTLESKKMSHKPPASLVVPKVQVVWKFQNFASKNNLEDFSFQVVEISASHINFFVKLNNTLEHKLICLMRLHSLISEVQ